MQMKIKKYGKTSRILNSPPQMNMKMMKFGEICASFELSTLKLGYR